MKLIRAFLHPIRIRIAPGTDKTAACMGFPNIIVKAIFGRCAQIKLHGEMLGRANDIIAVIDDIISLAAIK